MLILLCTNCGPRINHDMCWGHSQMRNVVEKNYGSSRGLLVRLWQWCVVRVYPCVAGWVITIEWAYSRSLLSSSFSLPLVDYVGVFAISRLNGGSVGPWMESIWLPSRNGEWVFCRGKCSFGHCLSQDDGIDLWFGKLGDDEVSRRLRDVQDKAAIKT